MSIISGLNNRKIILSLLIFLLVCGTTQMSAYSQLSNAPKVFKILSKTKKTVTIFRNIKNVRSLKNISNGFSNYPATMKKATSIATALNSADFCKNNCDEILKIILHSGAEIKNIVFRKDFIAAKVINPDFTKKYLKPILKIGDYTLIREAKIIKSTNSNLVKIEGEDMLVIARDYSTDLLPLLRVPQQQLFAILGKLKRTQTISPLVKKASEVAAEKSVKDAIARGVEKSSINQLRALTLDAADHAAQEKLMNEIVGTRDTGISLSKSLFDKTILSASDKALKKLLE
jgi:hypothetical protein